MSARPTQPVGDDGQPIGLATVIEPEPEEDVLGHIAPTIPTADGDDAHPKLAT